MARARSFEVVHFYAVRLTQQLVVPIRIDAARRHRRDRMAPHRCWKRQLARLRGDSVLGADIGTRPRDRNDG